MKKQLLAFVFCTISTFIYSQELTSSFPIELKNNRDVFQIVNDSLKQTSFFISDKETVRFYLLDEKLIYKDTISSPRPEKKFKDILGYSGNKINPTIYWATTSKDKICAQAFDLQNRKVSIKEFELKLSKNDEKYLQIFSENNKFYILTIKLNSDALTLYVFENNQLKEKEINLNTFKLYKNNHEYSNIYKIFSIGVYEEPIQNSFEIAKISPESVTSLSESAKKRKCYSNKNQIIISLDYHNVMTQLITIDLKSFKASLKNISKPIFDNLPIEEVKSNSFLIDNKLLLLTLHEKELNLSIKDLENNLIKEYKIHDYDDFKIKNSTFSRKKYSGTERELATTEQFLRKIVRSNISISAYNLNGNYLLTLGCVSPEARSGGGMGMGGIGMGMGGMAIAGGFAAMNFMQPINFIGYNFYSYGNRRTITTDCLFTFDFIHLESKLETLAFDKIQDYKDANTQNEAETIFKINNIYYLGFYNSSSSEYNFLKFTE